MRCQLAGYVATASADSIAAVLDFNPNRVPAAVLPSERGVAQVVLLAQFVGDAGSGRIEVAGIAHDLGAASAVVGDLAQRGGVDAIVRAGPPAAATVAPARRLGLRLRESPARAARERHGNRQTNR